MARQLESQIAVTRPSILAVRSCHEREVVGAERDAFQVSTKCSKFPDLALMQEEGLFSLGYCSLP
jgi:hypothetical protein